MQTNDTIISDGISAQYLKTIPISDDECLKDSLPRYLHKAHVTILTGPPYMGKSRFALWLSYQAAMGLECFWGQIRPLRVLYCSERSRTLMVTQIKGLGIDLPDPKQFKMITLGDMDPKNHAEFRVNPLAYVSKIAKEFKPDIIILDTLVHFLPMSESKNINDYGSMADRIMRVQIEAYNLNSSILAVHHTAKERDGNGYGRVLEKSLGSQAIPGGTASAWNLSPFDTSDNSDVKILFSADTHAYQKPEDIIIQVLPNEPLAWYPASQFLNQSSVSAISGPLQKAIIDTLTEITEPLTRKDLVQKVKSLTDSHENNIYKAIAKMIDKKLLIELKDDNSDKVIIKRNLN